MAAKPKTSFGSFAKNARLKAGFGLRQVARKISISAAYLSRVENGMDDPSGELMADLARLYNIPIEDLTSRATKPKASAAAHGHSMQASPELRALYRLGAQFEPADIEELIRNFLRGKGETDRDIEKQLAQLKSELPRVAKSVRDGLFAAEAKPRFLSKQRITDMAYEILKRNGITQENYVAPTPVELVVENEPGVLYRIEKLKCDTHGNPLVLGLTGWDECGNRQIVINSVLADSNRDSEEHRFNFTLGHELFHAIEHLPRVPKDAVAPLARVRVCDAVFVDKVETKSRSVAERAVNTWSNNAKGPRVLSTDEDWREWQANVYSSALLMPAWAVTGQFRLRFGAETIVVSEGENPREVALLAAGERVFASDISEQSLADLFAVSRQAMAIRLIELGLVKEDQG
jgi:transcriptional regulator with XRE-family HTH domain